MIGRYWRDPEGLVHVQHKHAWADRWVWASYTCYAAVSRRNGLRTVTCEEAPVTCFQCLVFMP